MRTTEEIMAYYAAARPQDWLGFWGEVLLPYLSVEQATLFMSEQTKRTEWVPLPLTEEQVLKDMRQFMDTAWTKVAMHRSMSASRSVEKLCAWLWLLGMDDAVAFASDPHNYIPYGAPVLAHICRRFGWPIPDTTAIHRMIQGEPCEEFCAAGCL